jgi:hypothetical protein
MTPTNAKASGGRNLRRSRRQRIVGLVTGQLVVPTAPIKICDISAEGFGIETSAPLRVGEVLAFRFTSKDGSSFLLRASVAHCRQISDPNGSAIYVSGLKFAAQQTPTGQQAIKALLEKVNHILAHPRIVSA